MAIHTSSANGMGGSTLSGSTITNTGMEVHDHMHLSEDLLANAGIVGFADCQVVQNGTPNMSINVNPGRGYILNTNYAVNSVTQNKYWRFVNDTAFNVAINSNSSGNPRITSIFAKFLSGTTPDSTASNVTTFVAVDGTAAASPVAPAAPSDGNSYLRLADMTVANAASSIVTANIVDQRVMVGVVRVVGPSGFLLNGQISRTVSSNNLTIAIKTLAGSDPTTAAPVYVRIANTIVSITAALSVTVNAGTNWMNLGSAELSTQDTDVFVYLGIKASDGSVFIGFSRIPNGRLYSDFSGTSTNEKYFAGSTTPASTDALENVGRVNVTLGVSASYNWSIPGTSTLIQKPTTHSRILTYACSPSPQGGTFTGVSVTIAKYQIQEGALVYVTYDSTGIVGSGVTEFRPTLPFAPSATSSGIVVCRGGGVACQGQTNSGGIVQILTYNAATFATGSQSLGFTSNYVI